MANLIIVQRNRAVWMLQTGMSSRAVARALNLSFDHSASLDIILADRRSFGSTKNSAPEGHDPCTRPVSFLICS